VCSSDLIVRINPDGTIDETFNPGTGANGPVYDIKLQADGLPVIGGDFTAYNDTLRRYVARLQLDGTLDTRFLDTYYNQTQAGTDQLVVSLAVQADGKVMIGGAFSQLGGGFTATEVLTRYNVALLVGGTNPPSLNAPGNVEFTAPQYSVDENSDNGAITLAIQRINGELGPLTVTCTTRDGTALAGRDYSAVTNTITWFDCDWGVRYLSVPIIDNTNYDGNRTFYVTLSAPVGVGSTNTPAAQPSLGFQSSTLVTIIDNDFRKGVLGFSAPVYEVNESGGSAIITVIRTNGAAGVVSVQYATSNGSAVAGTGPGADYNARSGTLTFQPGETSKTFSVPIINDTAKEFE
jgi:hypothetical protein